MGIELLAYFEGCRLEITLAFVYLRRKHTIDLFSKEALKLF
jgi:hypothetical protein